MSRTEGISNLLSIPRPYSAGIFLTYRCPCACKHCMYACSPRWEADWFSPQDGESILAQFAEAMRGRYAIPGRMGVNQGVHFSGGEPFLNFELLLYLTETAKRLGIPTTFVETNAIWCRDDQEVETKLDTLRRAGLDGILISANPFLLEHVPFGRTQRAARIAEQVFAGNLIVYQPFFFEQFRQLGLRGTLAFEEYLRVGGFGLGYVELFPSGRAPYKLSCYFRHYPASHFFGQGCREELVRDWHVHVDNYAHFVPGYCGGLSLGDARDLGALQRGIELSTLPVLHALLSDLKVLFDLGKEYGYVEQKGYISKCHLCVDVRRHLALTGDFQELQPRSFYERLED